MRIDRCVEQSNAKGHCHSCGYLTDFDWSSSVFRGNVIPGWACEFCGHFTQSLNIIVRRDDGDHCVNCGDAVRRPGTYYFVA